MTKTVIKNTVVIGLLLVFLGYLGMATHRRIKAYNESLVEVRVTMPGLMSQVKFYAFDTVVEEGSKITFAFDDAEVTAGGAAQLIMDVRLTRIVLNALPFELLREEENKYYFYEVFQQRGVWGDEYVIKKTMET